MNLRKGLGNIIVGVFLFQSLFLQKSFADSADIQCWGNNAYEQLNVPSNLVAHRLDGEIRDVHTGRGFTCVLTSKEKIDCWGAHTPTAEFLMSLEKVSSFAIGATQFNDESYACANTAAGVKCFNMIATDAKFSTSASIGVGGSGFACALDNAEVQCWGIDRFKLPVYKNPKKMAIGTNYICVLDDNGVNCTNNGRSSLKIEEVAKLVNPTNVFISIGYACASEQDGLKCWGNPSEDNLPSIPVVPKLNAQAKYALGEYHLCALADNKVQCWGINSSGQLEVPKLTNPKRIFSDYSGSQICAVDDSGLVCWGANTSGQSSIAAFDSISAGFGNTCVSNHGKIKCWGRGSQIINRAPQNKTLTELTGVYQVGLGSNFACAFDQSDESEHSCWGENMSLVGDSPQLPMSNVPQNVPVMSVGFSHVCFIRNSVSCFGSNNYGESSPPPNMTLLNRPGWIAAGGHHTCAIDNNKNVQCWGQDRLGQMQVPKNLKNPKQVVSGFGHSCVLDEDGIKCWGRNREGQTKVPELKNPIGVQAGGFHTCAIDDDGVKCWGDNSFGQTNVPKSLGSKISNLTTGYLHNCAVRK